MKKIKKCINKISNQEIKIGEKMKKDLEYYRQKLKEWRSGKSHKGSKMPITIREGIKSLLQAHSRIELRKELDLHNDFFRDRSKNKEIKEDKLDETKLIKVSDGKKAISDNFEKPKLLLKPIIEIATISGSKIKIYQ